MDESNYQQLAEIYQALADANRLRIIGMLQKNAYCVNALARKLEISQSAVSQHLKILRLNGLVSAKKESYFKNYSVNKEKLEYLQELWKSIIAKDV